MGKGTGMALVAILVGDLADSFNIGKNMSGAQILDTAMLLVHDYPELKIDDVAFCFSRGKKGFYGELYDRLDSAIIFKWVERFIADKLEQVEYYWQHQQRDFASNGSTLLINAPKQTDDATAIGFIKEIQKTVSQISWRNRQVSKTIATPNEENVLRSIHEKFYSDFKALYAIEEFNATKITRGNMFIPCCGKKMDVVEYIEHKHKQLMAYQQKINLRWGIIPPPSIEEIRATMKAATPEILSKIKAANVLNSQLWNR